MNPGIKVTVILFTALVLVSCGKQENKPEKILPTASQLIPVQQEPAGDFNVVVYNYQKDFKKGEGSFAVVFRDLHSGDPKNVINIKTEAVTKISGNTTAGETTVTAADSTGWYDVEYNFPVKGTWYFDLKFNDSLDVQFIFSVN